MPVQSRERVVKRALLLLLLVCPANFVGAESDRREVILWYVSDFPPSHILSGPQRGQGMGDRRIQIFTQQLSQFRHQIAVAPFIRFIEAVKTEPNACNAGLLKTPEREAFIEFSAAPYGEALSNGIITTRGRMALFTPFINEFGDLRLNDFLASGKARVGVIPGRSFGAGIDTVLKKYADRAAVVASTDHLATRLVMLANENKFDAAIGYPTELRYLTRELGLDEQNFVFLPVVEEPPLLPAYIACSKSAFGRQVMAAINRALADVEVQNQITAAYIAWLDDETAARYKRLRKPPRVPR
jgi:uncharacterized protein (TIGR02285 family)